MKTETGRFRFQEKVPVFIISLALVVLWGHQVTLKYLGILVSESGSSKRTVLLRTACDANTSVVNKNSFSSEQGSVDGQQSAHSDAVANSGEDNNPRVALMYMAPGHIHNEPIWRAFFEAAGRLQFRFEFPQRPDVDFTEGEGREQFDRIKNELTGRALRQDKTPIRTVDCAEESEHIRGEVKRLSGNSTDSTDSRGVISNQRLFAVYTHPTKGFQYPETSIFRGTEISDRVNLTNSWGGGILVLAEINLIRAALTDKHNKKFALFSESCVPLYKPEVVYLNLISEKKSRIDACKSESLDRFMHRYDENMTTPFFNESSWRKTSQWKSLTRAHAEIVIEDDHLFERFSNFCLLAEKYFCDADESYIASLLALHGRDNETDCIGRMTQNWWTNDGGPHPLTFFLDDVHSDLFRWLRGSESTCPGALAQASTQFLFGDKTHQNHCVTYNAADLIFTLPQNVDDWITKSGFQALDQRCPLFARKFPKESVEKTLEVSLSCDGVGLGYWC